jgi:hypothetical protein
MSDYANRLVSGAKDHCTVEVGLFAGYILYFALYMAVFGKQELVLHQKPGY